MHAFRHRNHVRAGLLALALACFWLNANALGSKISRTATPQFEVRGNTATLVTKPTPGTFTSAADFIREANAVSGGKIELGGSRLAPWSTRFEEAAMAKWKARVPASQIAKKIAGVGLGGVVGPLVLGYGIHKLMEEACVRLMGGGLQLAEGQQWEECVKKTEPGAKEFKVNDARVTKWASTKVQACNLYFDVVKANASPPYVPSRVEFYDDGSEDGQCRYFTTLSTNPSKPEEPGGSRVLGSRQSEVAETTGYQPTTRERAAQALEDAIPESNSLPGIARDFLDRGGEMETDDDGFKVSPGPLEGDPKTSEKTETKVEADPQPGDPEAKKKTETTTKTTEKDKYTYDKDKIDRDTKTDTETCVKVTNGAGVTSQACDSSTSSTNPPKDTDLCKANPTILACQETDVPEEDLPKGNKTLTYQEQNLFGFGSCPADKYTSIRGQNVKVWDWAAACDTLGPFRGVVLVCAAFTSFLILVPGKGEA